MKILYCDCFSGISGDMFLSAMIDAGLPVDTLTAELNKLGLPEFAGIKTGKVMKGALSARRLEFDLGGEEHHHDHDHDHDHSHSHSDEHEHSHEHGHRHLSGILEMINTSTLSDSVKQKACAIFQVLGEAEAKVHGIDIESVHFHEVGAADSILDIVGAAVALDYFDIRQVYASAIPLGSGTVETMHGLLPLPAPATLELLTRAKAKTFPSPATQEMVTPTGAAILAAFAKFETPQMTLQATGLGAGGRDLPWPNVLRLMLGESLPRTEEHVELETNIDDMNPQYYAPVMQHLFEAGALDVYLTPIYMKKNRPGIKLSVIAPAQEEAALAQIILKETSTLGVRSSDLRRYEANREFRKVQTAYGEINIKLKVLDGQVVRVAPEYEDCAAAAERAQVSVDEVFQSAQLAARAFLSTKS
jgi:uncharacterized protein (TIGR00299 family) protein